MPHALEIPPNDLTSLDYASNSRQCRSCGVLQNPLEAGIEVFQRPKGGPRLSMTPDGLVIQSPRFLDKLMLWNAWRAATASQWLACGYYLTVPRRIVRTTQSEDALARGLCCETCGVVRLEQVRGQVSLHFAEPVIGPKEVVATDFVVPCPQGAAPIWIVGNALAEALTRHPQGKLRVGQEVVRAEWPTGEGDHAPSDKAAEVLHFPKAKRPPPKRGSIRNPLLPD